MTTPNTSVTTTLEVELQHSIARHVTALEFLQANREKLDKLNLRFNHPYGNYVDFDGLQRPDVLAVLKAFAGKWDKSPGYNGGITYTSQHKVNGMVVRCYNGEPPPSCKIVETVTYKKVPARRERIVTRTVVCSE